MAEKQDLMEKIVSLAKRRGFIYPGSDLYGGLANTYDYGPVGTELLRNIRNLWWKTFVQDRDDIVGLEASIISHHSVWDATGHTTGFSDAMIDCRNCKSRFRADHLIEDWLEKKGEKKTVEGMTPQELSDIIREEEITCPKCGETDWTDVKAFNLMFPLNLGIVEGDQSLAYLRGETAQGMFINFDNVVNSTRVRLPFGIAQVGKSFRNEITLGNSVFRTVEFDQGEVEYFFNPDNTDWEELFESWKKDMWDFVTTTLGVHGENLQWRVHNDDERSFYSKRTEDLEYRFPFGMKELWGLAYRTDYDLKKHIEHSGRELFIVDPQTNEKVVPHVIEPALGLTRALLMVLLDAYHEEPEQGRVIMRFSPHVAPFKAAIFPLLANKPELAEKAREVYLSLKKQMNVTWDDRGNIGKRYLYQDEIGTPWCVTIDFDSLEDDSVTVRDRDTAKQDRLKINELAKYFEDKLS